MKRAKFWLKIVLSLPFFIWLYTRTFWPSTLLDAPEILANLYAKEMCSCVYVVGQTEDVCLENTRQFMSAGRIVVDRDKSDVSTRVLWAVAQAKYKGADQGCLIEILE